MPALHSPALILRAGDRGDDDRWLALLTPGRGRVHVLARHARGSRRRFAGALQPFVLLDAALRSRPGGPVFLEGVRALEHPLGNEPGLERLAAAWLLLELAEQCCHEGTEQSAFFELVLGGLRRLGLGREGEAAVRLSVLWGALALEGWAPSLDACVRCGRPGPWERLSLDPLAGGCLCGRCLPPGVPALGADAWEAWKAAADGRPIPAVPEGAEASLRAWLQHQTGRPLRGPESLAPVLETP